MVDIKFQESLFEKDLIGLDSEYTYSTRKLVEIHGAKGAHLNKWWVRTDTRWCCPCCKRNKSEIVRMNQNEDLTCQLHEHHDHMKEVVKSMFERISISNDIVVADELSERFATKVAFSLSAFDNTIVCFDCNEIDAKAKSFVNAEKYFSFSPKEIGEFVIATPNTRHEIDKPALLSVWERVKPILDIRLSMAENFATIAANKKDWYQPSQPSAKETKNRARRAFQNNNIPTSSECEPESILYNTEKYKGDNDAWRRKNHPISNIAPSDKDIDLMAKKKDKNWIRYPDNWICPCCERTKFTCVRPTKKEPWAFKPKTSALFIEIENKVDYRPKPMCLDCADAAINLGKEVFKEGNPGSVITLTELSKVVIARPHSKHDFNNKLINDLIPTLKERSTLITKIESKKYA